jgi:hypothetical protein
MPIKRVNLASANGITNAKEDREAIATLMTAKGVSAAQKLAREWQANRL